MTEHRPGSETHTWTTRTRKSGITEWRGMGFSVTGERGMLLSPGIFYQPQPPEWMMLSDEPLSSALNKTGNLLTKVCPAQMSCHREGWSLDPRCAHYSHTSGGHQHIPESTRRAFGSTYWYRVTPVYYTRSMLNTHGRSGFFSCHDQVQIPSMVKAIKVMLP